MIFGSLFAGVGGFDLGGDQVRTYPRREVNDTRPSAMNCIRRTSYASSQHNRRAAREREADDIRLTVRGHLAAVSIWGLSERE